MVYEQNIFIKKECRIFKRLTKVRSFKVYVMNRQKVFQKVMLEICFVFFVLNVNSFISL